MRNIGTVFPYQVHTGVEPPLAYIVPLLNEMTASPSQGFERESERRIKRDIHVFYTILRCVIHPAEPTSLLVVTYSLRSWYWFLASAGSVPIFSHFAFS